MGLKLEPLNYYDNSGGLDLLSSQTKIAEDAASAALNVDYTTDGAFGTRNGSTIQNITSGGIPSQMSGAPTTLALYDFHKSDGTEVELIFTSDGAIKTSLTTPVDAVTGLTASAVPDMEYITTNSDEYLVIGNGSDANLKFNGLTWYNLSMPRGTLATAADNGVGNLPVGDYYYYVSNAVTSAGVIVQESELSPVSAVTTIVANRQILVTIAACSETLATGVTAQCNARVIYRISPTSGGIAYRLTTISDNTTLTYSDNTAADGTIRADFDNQAPVKSAIIEQDDNDQTWYVDASSPTDIYISKAARPWNAPTSSLVIFDGPIKCLKRCFGAMIIGTDRSIWMQNGPIDAVSPRKISSKIGIVNNRAAAGEDILYFMATNRKLYSLSPTDFSQNEMRISESISDIIGSVFDQIGGGNDTKIAVEYYTKPNLSRVVISAPYGTSTNNRLFVYNETQSLRKQKPVWQMYDNLNAACLKQMRVSSDIALYSGDYNGFIWKLDDSNKHGDGAEVNGTTTSAGASTLVDSTAIWAVNAYVGMTVRIVSGTGIDQVRTISSNTATTLTVSSAWVTSLDTTSIYTIGGYDSYHYTNWKPITDSYDNLKQLWYINPNANTSGSYSITLILQLDYNSVAASQTSVTYSLASSNSIWGSFIWGQALWGAQSVANTRIRQYQRFRAIRFGFSNRKAGQPFQINGFSVHAQDKGMFYGAAS